jgi:hypothetical protein
MGFMAGKTVAEHKIREIAVLERQHGAPGSEMLRGHQEARHSHVLNILKDTATVLKDKVALALVISEIVALPLLMAGCSGSGYSITTVKVDNSLIEQGSSTINPGYLKLLSDHGVPKDTVYSLNGNPVVVEGINDGNIEAFINTGRKKATVFYEDQPGVQVNMYFSNSSITTNDVQKIEEHIQNSLPLLNLDQPNPSVLAYEGTIKQGRSSGHNIAGIIWGAVAGLVVIIGIGTTFLKSPPSGGGGRSGGSGKSRSGGLSRPRDWGVSGDGTGQIHKPERWGPYGREN